VTQSKPPYTTDDILKYYTQMDFDYGVSIDHLLFGASTEHERAERYELTMQNALEFIDGHKRLNLAWTPIGALQGENPQRYADAAKQYVAAGYRYLAIGGQVRSRNKEIIAIAEAIHQQVILPHYKQYPDDLIEMHLFGVARLDGIPQFMEHGITSVDSASYLRQAWIRMGQNYIGTNHRFYAAIRIPEATKRTQKLEDREQAAQIQALEQETLVALWAYDQCPDNEQATALLPATLELVKRYSEAVDIKLTPKMQHEYELTLRDRPWQACNCPICRESGINVIIFRGNNRNRRRGFHNNYVFYQCFQETVLSNHMPENWGGREPMPRQLTLI
jgi:hypothetical protein